MRTLTGARACIVAIAVSWPAIVLAQSAPTPPPGIPEAPIGHRQPTAGSVPANDSVKGLGADAAGGDTFGPALRSLPKLDIKATCSRAQPISGGEKSAYQGCLNDEIEAQKQLSRSWFSFKAGPRGICAQETRIGGAPSYVELLTCLELDKQAAEASAENKKQLKMPAPSRVAAPPK
ncbi:hypothetical protein SAMN05444161_1357 [Rhizobiales bacterium GAS191]|nr:hypothetical protein SAMN05519103_00469 [Rhizobiales bacterium GAS113]SEC55303.1 hypothetical protein SAMN05444161_1357 [Rhizobiales bacterium GAS191]SEC72010.1 hypothetical protein SAMN05519104_1946 [Rhizobiales bacterium GAS188]